MAKRKTAGELSKKAMSDDTNYNVLELAHYLCEDIPSELRKSINIYKSMIDEPEFCVVMLIGKDPLIPNLIRRKFYCWPYLPSPRPNQSVWLYSKAKDDIIKRLWVLPPDTAMAKLAYDPNPPFEYLHMQAWTCAFYAGRFWEYIRHEHEIDMLSESEYLKAHRDKLIQSGCKVSDTRVTEPFDFSKISIKNIVDTNTAVSE